MLQSPLRYCHQLLSETISSGDKVIDATVGNGHDTIKLAQLVGPQGHVYGFDIQQSALEETQKKLLLTGITEQVTLFHQGHETIQDHVQEAIQAVVFNLGYLPKSDKAIITLPETTLAAIEQSLNLLNLGGIVTIMVYYGHAGGEDEKNAVENYLQSLPQDVFSVLRYGFINQKNTPPFLIAIEKKK